MNGDLSFFDPRGNPVEVAPAGTDVGQQWGATIRRWIHEADVDVDEETNFPAWDGQRVDYAAAVEAVVGW